MSRGPAVALVILLVVSASVRAESVCRGTTADGELENGCRLPSSGSNFSSYSRLGSLLGRTYVHCTVTTIVVEAYSRMARERPDVRFVYGETGFAEPATDRCSRSMCHGGLHSGSPVSRYIRL